MKDISYNLFWRANSRTCFSSILSLHKSIKKHVHKHKHVLASIRLKHVGSNMKTRIRELLNKDSNM